LQLEPFIPPQIQLEKISGLQVAQGIEVSILRLDKIHDAVSGNKWLKLQGWLAQANAKEHHGVMTAGGPWSNHIHAAAAWCHLYHLPFHAIVKGKDGLITPMLQDVLTWNGKITWVNNAAFKDENHWQHEAEKANLQWIPMGGDGMPGETGVKDFFDQLAHFHFDELWCAAGTGTTLTGIAASAIGADTLVAFDPGIADKKVHEKMHMLQIQFPKRKISIRHTLHDKFGSISSDVINSMNAFYAKTAIPTDIVYTGKMMHLLLSEILLPINCEKKSILIVHTGGLQGNRSLAADELKFIR
jgi:1-aminocyclopropane-1-carboxylate deaminase